MDFEDEKTIVSVSTSATSSKPWRDDINDGVTIQQRDAQPRGNDASSETPDTLNDEETFIDSETKAPPIRTSYDNEPDLAEINERYVLLKRLGAGASGAVYLARDRETGTLRALKGMPVSAANEHSEALKNNYRLTEKLVHENIAVARDWLPIQFASYKDGATAAERSSKETRSLSWIMQKEPLLESGGVSSLTELLILSMLFPCFVR